MEKPFRVISPHDIAWSVRFVTEEAAWGRLLALKGGADRRDTPENRTRLLRDGWKVKETEVTSGTQFAGM